MWRGFSKSLVGCSSARKLSLLWVGVLVQQGLDSQAFEIQEAFSLKHQNPVIQRQAFSLLPLCT